VSHADAFAAVLLAAGPCFWAGVEVGRAMQRERARRLADVEALEQRVAVRHARRRPTLRLVSGGAR
jgi:hypothetical protein